MERQTKKKHTVSLDGDSKLLRLVEDVVEILVIQLGPEEGVPVHCYRSAKIPRRSEVSRANQLPGVNGSRFVKFFPAKVWGVSEQDYISAGTRRLGRAFIPLNWKYFPWGVSAKRTRKMGRPPRIHTLPLESIPNFQTSSPRAIQPLVDIRVKACGCQDPRTTRGRRGRCPPRASFGMSRDRSRRLHLGSHSPCLRSAVLVGRLCREHPIRCLRDRALACGCKASEETDNTTLQNPKPLEDTELRNLSFD